MFPNTLFIAYLFGIFYSFSQNCNNTLEGKVIDLHTQKPLTEAKIYFGERVISTNSQGAYRITGLCNQTYIFSISHPDCNSHTAVIDANTVSEYDFILDNHYTSLDKIKISTNQINTHSQVEQLIVQEQMADYQNLSIGDALQQLSGVQALHTGNTISKPLIQGLHSSRILMLNNGVRQEDQEWGVEHAPNMDTNAFSSIRVIKGAGALEYGGNAIGGVVIAENNIPTGRDTIFGQAHLGVHTNEMGAGIGSTINLGLDKGWGAKFQIAAKKFGDSRAPNYVLSNTAQDQISFATGVAYDHYHYGVETYYSFFSTRQGILRASHLGNRGDQARAIQSQEPLFIADFTYEIAPPKQETQHQLLKIKAFNRFESLGKLTMQYALQHNHRKEFDIRRGADKGKPSLDLTLTTHTLDLSFQFARPNFFVKKAGIQTLYQENFPDPETGVRRLIPDYEKLNFGIFATNQYKFSNRFALDVAARYDFSNIDAKKFYLKTFWEERGYTDEFSNLIIADFNTQWLTNPNLVFHSFAVHAGVQYAFGDGNKLLGNLSLSNRAPNPVELFSDGLHHSAAIIEIGNLRFRQESSTKLSLQYENSKLWSKAYCSISPYLHAIQNFILLQPAGEIQLTTRGEFVVHNYVQTDVLLSGVDLDFRADLMPFLKFQTNFSYIFGENLKTKAPLFLMPPPNVRSELAFERSHWGFRLISQTEFRQSRFPNTNFEDTFISNGEVVVRTIDNSTPPAGYTIFDLGLQYRFTLWHENDLEIAVNGTNIFNTSYRSYLNRQRFYADAIGRNFLFAIHLKF